MIRMSPEEYQAKQAEMNAKLRARLDMVALRRPGEPVKVEKKAGKKNLYGAQRVEIMGVTFDSKAEGKRFLQLKAMEQAGEIQSLEVQPEFELIPGQNVDGKKERPVKYVADFRYTRAGQSIVEDVKSAPTKTREFIIKRKLMLLIHNIIVKEVLMP